MTPLVFLLKLAWDCRYRLPLLITVGFMVLDIRMQLDINVQTRRVQRPHAQHRGFPQGGNGNGEDIPDEDDSDDSWATIEENNVLYDDIY